MLLVPAQDEWEGMTALHKACMDGELSRVQAWIAAGVDVNADVHRIGVRCPALAVHA